MKGCGHTWSRISWRTYSLAAEVLMLKPARFSSRPMVSVPPVRTEPVVLPPLLVVLLLLLLLLQAARVIAARPIAATTPTSRLLGLIHAPIVGPHSRWLMCPRSGLKRNGNLNARCMGNSPPEVSLGDGFRPPSSDLHPGLEALGGLDVLLYHREDHVLGLPDGGGPADHLAAWGGGRVCCRPPTPRSSRSSACGTACR